MDGRKRMTAVRCQKLLMTISNLCKCVCVWCFAEKAFYLSRNSTAGVQTAQKSTGSSVSQYLA